MGWNGFVLGLGGSMCCYKFEGVVSDRGRVGRKERNGQCLYYTGREGTAVSTMQESDGRQESTETRA